MQFVVYLNDERFWPDVVFDTENAAICAVMKTGLTSAHGHRFAVVPKTGTLVTTECGTNRKGGFVSEQIGCTICGATNYPASFGGPDICPSCEAGKTPRIHNPIICADKEYWVPHDVAVAFHALAGELSEVTRERDEAEARAVRANTLLTDERARYNYQLARAEAAERELDGLRGKLELMYDKWENGVPCHEDPESQSGFVGNAFTLTDEEERGILALLPPVGQQAPEA